MTHANACPPLGSGHFEPGTDKIWPGLVQEGDCCSNCKDSADDDGGHGVEPARPASKRPMKWDRYRDGNTHTRQVDQNTQHRHR